MEIVAGILNLIFGTLDCVMRNTVLSVFIGCIVFLLIFRLIITLKKSL